MLGPFHHAETLISTVHRFGGWFEITAMAPKHRPVKRYFNNPEVAAEWSLDVNAIGYNVFLGVNPRWAFGGHEDKVSAVVALPLDFDPGKHDDPEKPLDALCAFGIPPSITVRSGNGCHAYLLLASPSEPMLAKRTAERLCKATGSDRVHNVNRIMRLAGTQNWKQETSPKPCYITGLSPERVYTLGQIESALDLMGAPSVKEAPTTPPRQPEQIEPELKNIIAKLAPHAHELVHGGERLSMAQATRSETDFYVICELVRHDATDEQIREIYSAYPIGSLKYREAGDHYLNRTIERARVFTAESVEHVRRVTASDAKVHRRRARGSASENSRHRNEAA